MTIRYRGAVVELNAEETQTIFSILDAASSAKPNEFDDYAKDAYRVAIKVIDGLTDHL
jgi:hypothetical protein